MKQKLVISILAASYLSLAPATVYAIGSANICAALFKEHAREQGLKSTDRVGQTGHDLGVNSRASVDVTALQQVQLTGIPESKGISRRSITWLKGVFQPKFKAETETGALFVPGGKPKIYGGRPYIEFPNSTMMTTEDASGATRTWVLTRGVREYKDQINRTTGEISPNGYVSDVLLFEMVKGEPVFHSVYLESAPEVDFLFEDPRISVVPNGKGGKRFFLSGTDYSPHVGVQDNPQRDKDVMNRYVEVHVDAKTGVPQPVHVDPKTKQPQFMDLSPEPVKIADAVLDKNGKVVTPARYRRIDAKNATINMNDNGEVVVLARLRPDFKGDEEMLRLFDHKPWDYAEQTFVFKNWDEFERYDRRDLMVDLAGKASSEKTYGQVRPVVAKELMRNTDLKEHLRVADKDKDSMKIVEGEKGMGPGTRTQRLERAGNLLLISDGPGLPKYLHDVIMPSEEATFPMKDGEVIYGKLDHEIRKVKQKSGDHWLKRRHYSASVKLLNSRMDEMTDYLPDAVQPKDQYELGKDSGILDLLHVYPMGIGLVPEAGARIVAVTPEMIATVRAARKNPNVNFETVMRSLKAQVGQAHTIATAGISDAHTSIWGVRWKVLIQEARAFTAKHGPAVTRK